jgi:hypothetical protein
MEKNTAAGGFAKKLRVGYNPKISSRSDTENNGN